MLTAHQLERMAEGMLERAEQNLSRAGYLAHCVLGVAPTGLQVMALEVNDIAVPEIDEGSGTVLVPAPMRDHADVFRQLFENAGVHAAVEVSEYWTFPHDDPAAAEEYLAGRAGPPSEHPRRVEGVIVSAWWPMGGFSHILTRRLVRTPSGAAYLRPWTGVAAEISERMAAGDPQGMATHWLEMCLPAPDDRPRT